MEPDTQSAGQSFTNIKNLNGPGDYNVVYVEDTNVII